MKATLLTTHPEISKEWHPTLNGDLTPNDVSFGMRKKAWFQCPKNKEHVYHSVIYDRTGRNTNCPYCASRKICNSNCLATKNPSLASEWHPTKNGNLTPNDVMSSSNKKIWWICPKNKEEHIYTAKVCDRKYGCPYCSNQKICNSNCLATKNPSLANEWHPTKNGNLTPNDVVEGASRKVWWLCSENKKHEWITTVKNRKNQGCPHCCESKGEKTIANYLTKNNIEFERERKFNSCRNNRALPFDFYINNHRKLIEFQGTQHYTYKSFGSKKNNPIIELQKIQKNDRIKKEWCKENGIPLLEIPYWEFDNIEILLENFI